MSNPETLVLVDKRWLSMTISPWLLAALLLGMPAAIFVSLYFLFVPDMSWGELLVKLGRFLADINWGRALANLAMLVLAAAQFVYMYQAAQYERLTLTPEGIRYASPLPDFLKRLWPDWSLSWSEIRKAELGARGSHAFNAIHVQLTLHAASGKRRVTPAVWVDPVTYERPSLRNAFRFASMRASGEMIVKDVMASRIVGYIAEHVPHLAIESRLGKAADMVSIEKDPQGKAALVIIFALVLYAFVDALAGPESYIDSPSSLFHIYVIAGAAGALVAWMWLRRSLLPVAERAGLALLIGAVLGVAMLPGALRINGMTAPEPTATSEYFVTQDAEGVVLRPVKDGLPTIEYFARHAYWDKYIGGESYPVRVHKGVLGFYQFDSSVIIDDIHSH
ncbi:MAG: hypothetical protein V1879_02240 [Pseudomonadota bacterium]